MVIGAPGRRVARKTAGRNLLVKDFCYLRTVNVPAAVRSLSGWNIGTKVALDE